MTAHVRGTRLLLVWIGATWLAASPLPAQAPDAAAAGRLIAGPQFKQAAAFIREDYDRFVRELIALTEIPAPPFKEQRRAKAFLDLLRQYGLTEVEMDPEGNVMGLRKGSGGGPMLAVLAHLDTVFPEGTDVTVTRAGTVLRAPGIGDDTRGLALMLAVIRALDAAKFRTASDILFVGNVGEEGQGDLRGVKYLLGRGKYKDRIRLFLAIDGGAQGSVTRGGVGSRRYRVTFNGPGGHSYGAFGLVNPAYAMASAIARFSDTRVPASPRTTYNIGVVQGGTSVNSIPSAVSMDVDLRSESCDELKKLDAAFRATVSSAVDDENRVRSIREGRIAADLKLIGERPCGETPRRAPIVLQTTSVLHAFGIKPVFGFGSTDSNIPMSLGIPALTIGRGGSGGRSHSPDEWTDVEKTSSARAVEVALAIVLAVAGVS
jgi:acetylornithine deacetylase/succinyl-diaminopimelate desuccinylase-like protein